MAMSVTEEPFEHIARLADQDAERIRRYKAGLYLTTYEESVARRHLVDQKIAQFLAAPQQTSVKKARAQFRLEVERKRRAAVAKTLRAVS
jgi:hypothetical protein